MLRMLSATCDFGQVSGPMSTQFLFGGGGVALRTVAKPARMLSKAHRGQTDPEESPEVPFQHVKTKCCKGERSELFGCTRSVSSCMCGLDTHAWAQMNLKT